MNEDAASPPASPDQQNWNVALVGKPTATSRALCQVFDRARISIRRVNLDSNPAKAELLKVRDEIMACKPAIVVAGSQTAWNVLRVLNVWHPVGSLFNSAIPTSETSFPPVIPLPGIPETHSSSLFDYFATREISVGSWIRGFLEIFQSRSPLPPVSEEELDSAIAHFLAAKQRHDLKLTTKAGSHERNDAMAAVRVVQGAQLTGWLESDAAERAFQQVLATATNTPVANDDTTDNDSFASIVVADDEGFWARPLNPIWQRLGFELVHQPNPSLVGNAIADLETASNRVRVVLLDMQMQGYEFAGAKILRTLRQNHNHVPVIALSVDDQFSETVMLKRLGVFAYLNKHSLAEPTRGRDAVGAFRQMKDAIVTAAFASLAEDFLHLWRSIHQGCECLMQSESNPGGTEVAQPAFVLKLVRLGDQVQASLGIFQEECRRMFHGFWQDTATSTGFASRQIIRTLGLVNDKWCSMWTSWRFNPDDDSRYWSFFDCSFPYLAYHNVTTSIRGEASHAMLKDDDFSWLDVWIMFLTFFLKIDGTTRAFMKTEEFNTYKHTVDTQLLTIVRALRHLLAVSECISGQSKAKLERPSDEEVSRAFGAVENELKDYQAFPFSELQFPEGDARRLTVQPYLRARLHFSPTRHGVARGIRGPMEMSAAQLSANLLLLELIRHRISERI